MGHILNEDRFLSVCIFRHLYGLHQLLVFKFGLFGYTTDITDMTVERILHGSKAVLQSAYSIMTLGMGNLLIVISLGYDLGLCQKLI